MNNIDLSDWGNWDPIGGYSAENWFEGTFDGNGYTIKYMAIKMETSIPIYAGLFGRTLVNSTIKNVGMVGATIIAETRRANTSYAGGIVGNSASFISNCYFTGAVKASTESAPALVGGMAGDSTAVISNCYNRGWMSAGAQTVHIGGIAGRSYASISNCFNTGKVSTTLFSSAYAGGIVGHPFSISNCYNTGAVSAENLHHTTAIVGGIVGDASTNDNSKPIGNCYNTGAVSAAGGAYAHAGGIAGDSSSVSNCYNTGIVNTASPSYTRSGGIAGQTAYSSSSSLSNCYFLNNIQNATGSYNVTLINVEALSSDQMKQQSSYEGFDFDTIWTIKIDEYPTLQTLPVQDEHTTHTPTLITINSTCSMNGIQYTGCEVCGEVFSTIAMLPLKPHIFGEWVIGGVGVLQKCTVCDWEESAFINKIEINGKQTLIYKESTQLYASVILQSGEVINEIPANWSSENPNIVTVDPSSGSITANRAGETNIIATIERQAGDLTATYTVTVKLTFWQWLIKIILFGWIWY